MFAQYSVTKTASVLQTDPQRGLSFEEAGIRLERYGKNEMKEVGKKTILRAFFEQLNDPLIYVLMVAAIVSVLLGEISDAIIIGVVVGMNAVVGLIQEGKAQKALDSLKKLTSPEAVVIRDWVRFTIPARELVIGDLVSLEAGCQVPADLRLVSAGELRIEESALTGESLPMEKDSAFLAPEGKSIPLGDRRNMAYMSTMVTYGRGTGMVTATGMDTQIGQIAAMITDNSKEQTLLQKRLGELGRVLSLISLLLCAALFLIAIFQKRNVPQMLITAISLAVAAVPEGLPAVVTICLALSVTRMVKVNTIVRRLPSVETLGAVSVVCSDKTGTLTQNKMTVEQCYVDGQIRGADVFETESSRDFRRGMILCNDADVAGDNRIGDPTEIALLEYACRGVGEKKSLEQVLQRVGELPFDSERKMMSTLHRVRGTWSDPNRDRQTGQLIQYTKGAPDEVLKRCSGLLENKRVIRLTGKHRQSIIEAVEQMAGEALRTLAIAMRTGAEGEHLKEEDLVFLGLVGMRDPVRPEAADAVADFQRAGVTTVMITGDHIDTAYVIGKQLGIVEDFNQCMSGENLELLSEEELLERLSVTRVFARVSPLQKVRIVDGFKLRGEIVAMTGDGVNDAPSLKKADIGIAMGKTGTDVARQAADMVLVDDNFATIRGAIEEGRGVYENIRKSVIFLLSSNLGEMITMFLAVTAGLAAPLKSSYILWINLITDSLPALALGVDRNDGVSLMRQPPRKAKESLFARGGLLCTGFYGGLIAAVSLTAFLMLPCAVLRLREMEVTVANLSRILQEKWILCKAQTYTFTVLGMSQLWHAVGMRDTNKSVFRMKHLENKLMILACILGFLLQFAVTEIPIFVRAFGTSSLSVREWIRLTILAMMPILAHEIFVWTGRLFKR